MTFKLSERSLGKMEGLHEDLIKVIHEAIKVTPHDFGITEGLRSVSRQKEMVRKGLSKTMASRHLTGKAFDICIYINGKVTWENKYYEEVAQRVLAVSSRLMIPLTWGGSWKDFRDDVHFELDRKHYK